MAKQIKFYFLWLGLIMIGFFVLQNLPGIPGFIDSFVLNSKAVSGGQIWRFVSAIFLHGGIVHLLYNLFALFLFGFILEKLIGSRRFLIVFFISGIISNLVAVNFYDSSLGASGAIYGIFGCIVILRPMMMVWAFGLIVPMFVAGLLWVVGDIMGIFGFGDASIGRIAHLSGIFIGVLFGIFWRFVVEKVVERKDRVEIPEEIVKDWEEVYVKY